jgi:hypothetical protein
MWMKVELFHPSHFRYRTFGKEVAPNGWEGSVKSIKKHKEIDTPYALANYMKNKGYKSHKEDSYMESLFAQLEERAKK